MNPATDLDRYRAAPNLLRDRVILVTGAAAGVGRAASRAFAAHGATVVLLDRDQSALEALYDTIETAGHAQPALVPMDLEQIDEPSFQGLAVTLDQEFGRLDGLLHNAAIAPFLSRVDDYDLEVWQQVLQVNLTAPFLLTQVCLPLLRRAEDASVLFTSDRVGRRGRAYWGAYGVSKFALEGLMQILADETSGGNIRCNSIDPGAVRTGMRARLYPGENPERLPRPEAILSAYLYLMGPDSRGITGQAFSAQPHAA